MQTLLVIYCTNSHGGGSGGYTLVLFAQQQTQTGSSTYVAPQKLNPKAARVTIYRHR